MVDVGIRGRCSKRKEQEPTAGYSIEGKEQGARKQRDGKLCFNLNRAPVGTAESKS